MNINRVFLIVLDSVGIGAMPDAALFGDEGSNTLRAVMPYCSLPNLASLGLFNIDGVAGEEGFPLPSASPKAVYGRMAELSGGKDTTVGHWELCGIVTEKPFPTYPNGFPNEIIDEFSKISGRNVLCNYPYSGTDVIRDYGREHIETGALIVYTSADSVFQIAAHEDIIPTKELYGYCRTARQLLTGEHSIARVIARPFIGEYPNFVRTVNRKDFSVPPPAPTLLNRLSERDLEVISIGKINDIFAGSGITQHRDAPTNDDGIAAISQFIREEFAGLCFANLVEFDSLYGHRNDARGYAAALQRFDEALGELLSMLFIDDVLIITADHGCDPSTPSTDHSREYVPLLIYGAQVAPRSVGTLTGFNNVAAITADIFGLPYDFGVKDAPKI